MSTLGQNGRFGNQIFQYAYLRFYAEACGAQIETGDWIGRDIFGLSDPIVTTPPRPLEEGSFDAAAALLPNAKLKANVDLVGYFQLPTASIRPHRSKFRVLFELRGHARDAVEQACDKFGAGRRPVIALHLRRVDVGFGGFWAAPLEWYELWLETVWAQWTDPTLYIATDDPSTLATFARYRPVHAGMIDWVPPDLRFVLDFAFLARADAVGIDNSSFSFTAAMLNEHAKVFARPDPSSERLQTFDPWDSRPLINAWREPSVRPVENRIIADMIPKGAVVFDSDAGEGDWSRAVQTALRGRVKIFAFESHPAHIPTLERWARLTRPDAITIVSASVSGGAAPLPRNPRDAATADVGVDHTTIDEFCRTRGIRHINFLKASLTGGELALLQGSRTLLSHARIDFIQFGYGEAFRQAGLSLKNIFALLGEYGYDLFKVEHRIVKVPGWSDQLDNYRPAIYLAIHSRLTGLTGMGASATPNLRTLWRKKRSAGALNHTCVSLSGG
jgi:FkbM family methyltransferase